MAATIEDLWVRKDKTRRPNYGKGLRWRVLWEEDKTGKRRSKSFANKDAARSFLTSMDHKLRSGEYVPTENRKVVIGELLPQWEAGLIRLKPSTRGEIANIVRSRVEPRWGRVRVGDVRRQDVQGWVHELHEAGLAGRTVDTVYGWFRAFYTWATDEGYVTVSPCTRITLPRGHSREHIYLDPPQVAALIGHMDPRYRLFTEFLVTTGLRFGEAAELRVKDLDLPQRRATVNRAVTRGKVGTPKSHKRRSVPLTGGVANQLSELIVGRGRDDLVFTTARGSQLESNNWRVRYFTSAVKAAGLPDGLRPHDLRHTTASLLVRSGASVKALQTMMGHADAKITLQTYAGLYADELEDLGTRMGGLLGEIPNTHRAHMGPESLPTRSGDVGELARVGAEV